MSAEKNLRRIKIFKDIVKIKNQMSKDNQKYLKQTKTVKTGEDYTGTENLMSFGYINCQGILLYSQDQIGLAHIMPGDSALFYINSMKEEFDSNNLKAILLESDSKKFKIENLEKTCKDNKIEIVKSFDTNKDKKGVEKVRGIYANLDRNQVKIYEIGEKIKKFNLF